MLSRRLVRSLRILALVLEYCFLLSIANAQGAKQNIPQNPIADSDGDHIEERNEWFYRGRLVHGKPSAELRRQAYLGKLQMRARRAAALAASRASGQPAPSSGSWTPLGPMPLASDASGNGTQDYRQVSVVMSISTSGRALHSSPGHLVLYALWLPGIVVGCSAGRIRSPKERVAGLTAMLILLTLSLLSCGGVSNGSTTTTGNKPVIYQITVTGTSPGTTPDPGQSAVVTLVVD